MAQSRGECKICFAREGLFDREVNRERANKDLLALFDARTRETNRSTAATVKATKKVSAAGPNPSPALKKKLADDAAKDKIKHAVKLERHHANIKAATEMLTESDDAYIKSLQPPKTDEQRAELEGLFSTYSCMYEATRDSILASRENREAQLGSKGFSQALNSAIDRMVYGIDEFIDI